MRKTIASYFIMCQKVGCMRCRTCGNDAVKNQVNWQEFYYCRTCKTEVQETSNLKEDIELLYNLLVVKKDKLTPEMEKLLFATAFNSASLKEDDETHKKFIEAMDAAATNAVNDLANSDADDYDFSWVD